MLAGSGSSRASRNATDAISTFARMFESVSCALTYRVLMASARRCASPILRLSCTHANIQSPQINPKPRNTAARMLSRSRVECMTASYCVAPNSQCTGRANRERARVLSAYSRFEEYGAHLIPGRQGRRYHCGNDCTRCDLSVCPNQSSAARTVCAFERSARVRLRWHPGPAGRLASAGLHARVDEQMGAARDDALSVRRAHRPGTSRCDRETWEHRRVWGRGQPWRRAICERPRYPAPRSAVAAFVDAPALHAAGRGH
jgi:hypothetical protein